MPDFTVIGVYEDGEVFADEMSGWDAHDAIRRIANLLQADDLQIIGAVPGCHNVIAPCDESGKSAYVSDLRDKEPQ